MAIDETECDELIGALENFRDAWMPDSDASILPPKATSALALIAVLFAIGQPRLIALQKRSREISAPKKKTGEGSADTNSAPFDLAALRPLA